MGVAETARSLAQLYGENADKAYLAGLLHDCAKRHKSDEMLEMAMLHGIEPDDDERLNPYMLHAKLGEIIAREEFGVDDAAVLQAIRLHISGAPDMTRLDLLLNLADYTEPGRDFPEVDTLRALARENPEKALFQAFGGTICLVIKEGLPLNPNSVITYNELYKRLNAQEAVI